MKSGWKPFALLACLAAAVAAQAQEEGPVKVEAGADLASKYVWRGVVIDNDWVLQPWVSVGYRGFTASFWSSLELTDWNLANYERSAKGRFGEVDFCLDYAWELPGVSLTAGFSDYSFPNTGWPSYQEFSLKAAWEAPLSPWVQVVQGRTSRTGTSFLAGVERSVAVGSRSLDLALEVSFSDSRFNEFAYGNRKGALSYVQLCATTDLDLGRGWTLTPGLHFSALLDRGHLEGQPRRSNVWGSVGIAWSF